MSDIKIVSLNIKGVNHVIMRQKIISYLKKEQAQVAILQETHLTETEHLKLRLGWVGQVFRSSFNSHSRGVAILFHKKNVRFEDVIKDTGGCYIFILGQFSGERVLTGSVYAPNTFEPNFFPELIANISL